MEIKSFTAALILFFFLIVHQQVHAEQDTGLSLSVTPTLFQMSASPSQEWNSGVKVINNNKQPITVYANVVNFAPEGESGEGKFIPLPPLGEQDGSTLAEWMTISNEPIVIPPEQSYTFPFSVNVPENAAPGGHFAAILIGTKPPETEGAIKVATSQVVTSLFFVRIAGDVVEKGIVREFNVSKKIVSVPHADLSVRFENKGNVYLQPQGEIVITNMWGKERGTIPINQQTHFGNVLPDSIRKFEFSWSGEPSFSDIGRYKAILTLEYGDEGKKFVTSIAYFYVIPIKAGLIVLGSIIAFILFVSWCIKAYVRKMLLLAGVDPASAKAVNASKRSFVKDGDVRIGKSISMRAPVEKGVLDLKQRWQHKEALQEKIGSLFGFVISYRLFFISAAVFLIALCALFVFLHQATKEHRDYEVTINNKDNEVKLSSEEIIYNKSKEAERSTPTEIEVKEQTYDLVLVNSSETTGAAASLQNKLQQKGFTIKDLESDFERPKEKTVVVYDIAAQEDAITLGKLLNNALLSTNPTSTQAKPTITIYIGNDYAIE